MAQVMHEAPDSGYVPEAVDEEQAAAEQASDQEQAAGQAEEAGEEKKEGLAERLDNAGYGNVLSSALSLLGGWLSKNFPGSVGDTLKRVFDGIAGKLDGIFGLDTDIRGQMTRIITGSEETRISKEVADTIGMPPERFGADLEAAAGILSGSGADGAGNSIMEISEAISGSAGAYPAATGMSLKTFSGIAESWLQEHGDEYPGAAEDLATVNKALAESYFESVRQAEASGLALGEADRKALEEFTMYGVDFTYDEYVASVGMGLEDDGAEYSADPFAVRSDGSMEVHAGDAVAEVKEKAAIDVAGGGFADPSQDAAALAAWEADGRAKAEAVRGDVGTDLGEGYMAAVAEYQAYNDAAISAIAEKYADDPEARAAAEAGLALRMQAGLQPLFDAMKEDETLYGCFTDEQLEQLENLSITGVTTSYGDYEPGGSLISQEPEAPAAQEEPEGQAPAEAAPARTEAKADTPRSKYASLAAGRFGDIEEKAVDGAEAGWPEI